MFLAFLTQRVSLQQVTSSWSGKQASTAAPISAEGSTVKFSEEDSKDLGHQIVQFLTREGFLQF